MSQPKTDEWKLLAGKKTFSIFISTVQLRKIGSQKNSFKFHWFHTRNNETFFAGLKNTHVIQLNWIFVPNFLDFTQITLALKHMSSRSETFFSFSTRCGGKIPSLVKWFMRSSSTDNIEVSWSFFMCYSFVRDEKRRENTSNFPSDYLLNF